MKKIYFLLLGLMISLSSFGQDLIITAAYDGPLPGGLPKGIELYVVNDIPDLSIYGIGSANNGQGTDGEEFTFPADAVTAGTYLLISSESAEFANWFGTAPDYDAGSAMGINGDDAVELFMNGGVIDVFGDINVDGNGTPWEYLDGWAYRVDGTGPDGTTFVQSNWFFSGPNALDGETTNASAGSPIPVGTYSTTANTTPTISVGGAVSGLDYFEGNGPSGEDSFNVSAINLGEDLTVTAPANFEVATMSGGTFGASVTLSPDGSGTVASTPVFVRLAAGLAAGPYSGDATASSTGATNETVALSGTVSPADPQVSITGGVGSLDYPVGTGPSPEDSFNVSGLFLGADLTVTAPSNFEVSLSTGTGFGSSVSITPDGSGEVTSTQVFIRLASGLAVGPYSGDVTVSSTGATDEVLSVSGNVFGANTNALVLTGVFDGPLSGGTPKGVEIYVVENIADLSLFGIGSANNGGGTDGQEFTFPAVSATAGDYIYITNAATEFTSFFGFAADYEDGSMGINGDDAVELFENGTVIDTFGDINMDGTGEVWDFLDGWAYRVDDSGPDGGTFVPGNWTYSGINIFDGASVNGDATPPFPIGTYSTTLSIDSLTSVDFRLYPNPNSTGTLTINSTNNSAIGVQVFDVLGKRVINTLLNNNTVDVSALNSGLYIIKLTQDNISITKKLVIR